MLKNHPHPGDILREDVLRPLQLDINAAARRLNMSVITLSRILSGRRGIAPEVAIRLEQAGMSTARFWMNLQENFDLSLTRQQDHPGIHGLLPSDAFKRGVWGR